MMNTLKMYFIRQRLKKRDVMSESINIITRLLLGLAVFSATVVSSVMLLQRDYDGSTAYAVVGIFLLLLLREWRDE